MGTNILHQIQQVLIYNPHS